MWKRLIVILAALGLALSACGGEAELVDEPYEAVPYNLYPAPEDAYVGDTMPYVTDDGVLELYYLYDTDHNGQGYHPVWKYSTENLYEYQNHGEVLPFGLMSDPDPAIGTGSVLKGQDGLYHLFYTGHNDTRNGGKGKECGEDEAATDFAATSIEAHLVVVLAAALWAGEGCGSAHVVIAAGAGEDVGAMAVVKHGA
jgi:beta-fructofuranosidase